MCCKMINDIQIIHYDFRTCWQQAVRRCRDDLFERLAARVSNFGADDADGALSQDMTSNIQDIRILCALRPSECCAQKISDPLQHVATKCAAN